MKPVRNQTILITNSRAIYLEGKTATYLASMEGKEDASNDSRHLVRYGGQDLVLEHTAVLTPIEVGTYWRFQQHVDVPYTLRGQVGQAVQRNGSTALRIASIDPGLDAWTWIKGSELATLVKPWVPVPGERVIVRKTAIPSLNGVRAEYVRIDPDSDGHIVRLIDGTLLGVGGTVELEPAPLQAAASKGGDYVRVISGAFKGLVGRIQTFDSTHANVLIPALPRKIQDVSMTLSNFIPWTPNSEELVRVIGSQGTELLNGRIFKYLGTKISDAGVDYHYLLCTGDVKGCCPAHRDGNLDYAIHLVGVKTMVCFEPVWENTPAVRAEDTSKKAPKQKCPWCEKEQDGPCTTLSCVLTDVAHQERLQGGGVDTPGSRAETRRFMTAHRQTTSSPPRQSRRMPEPEKPFDVGPWSAEDVDYII